MDYHLVDSKMIEMLKKKHINHKCSSCKFQCVTGYEDNTPASYTPYHWWEGYCDVTKVAINSDKLPPEDCPYVES